MGEYNLSRQMNKTLSLLSRFYPTAEVALNEETIESFKRNELSRRNRKLLVERSRRSTSLTFIIPVRNTAIGGYYISVPEDTESMGSVPLIIYCHGGGWVMGNMELYSIYLSHLAEKVGASILLVDYRLAPQYKFPVALEDCYDALLWAVGGCKYWKVDMDRIYLAGDSIGGGLAASLSILSRDRKGPQVAGNILLYPLLDSRLRTESMYRYKDSPMLTEAMLNYYINNYSTEKKDILSPLFSPSLCPNLSLLPPTLILTAEIDPLADDGKIFANQLNKSGSKAVCFQKEGALHGFMPFRSAIGRKESECAIRQFIEGRPLENIHFCKEEDLKLH